MSDVAHHRYPILRYDPSIDLNPNKTELCHLPWDIKMNILSRLPVKTLHLCKCVSKEWIQMLTDPYFLKLQSKRSKSNPQLLLLDHCNHEEGYIEENEEEERIRISLLDMEEGKVNHHFTQVVDYCVDILPSGHGLVCFTADAHFYVCNPATQEFVALPKASFSYCSEVEAGFGYISSTNEYKVIHMFDRSSDTFIFDIGCEIFTLSHGVRPNFLSWRLVEEKCPYPLSGPGVLINNMFHWMIWNDDHCEFPDGDELIVTFDLDTEKFKTIRVPQVTSYHEGKKMRLVELRGLLCLTDTFAIPPAMEIWVLRDYENKIWIKEYVIDLSALDDFFKESLNGVNGVAILGYKNRELIVDSEQERVDFYHTENNSIRKGKFLNLGDETMMCLYSESCFSLGTRITSGN